MNKTALADVNRFGDGWLPGFVAESNRIEGILCAPTDEEIAAHTDFLAADVATVAQMEIFVERVQPRARLREYVGLNVQVGRHVAPLGGPDIRTRLFGLLLSAEQGKVKPWHTHMAYENLHPFTDGNGRSGRALWLRHMLQTGGRAAQRARELGFLHTFYYQTLEHSQ